MEKFLIGADELIIAFGDGIYHVLESSNNHETVFTGLYEECLEYCERREIAYKEATIG